MSTGGIFKLITNDGKQDRLINATELLNRRLLQIEESRRENPRIRDPTPTLVDIERTHILFVNAHFKPFASLAYEYGKTAVQAGTARLNSTVQFSIPQFGDFFNDMVLHVRLGAIEALESGYWEDPANNPVTPLPGGSANQLIRYVNYLGQALVKQVKFTVNNNPLDEYNNNVINFHQKYFVTPNKETGWNKLVAQEVPKEGYGQVGYANGRAGRGSGVRSKVEICDGPQTAKPAHGEIDIWMPLLFWFNKDPRLSIPSVSIPYGQRFINVTFARKEELLQHLHATNPALDAPAQNPVPEPDITLCELYINNIFVNPEIHDIFIKRIGFSLIRVYRQQSFRVSQSSNELLLSQFKWPIETIYTGLRPTNNIDVASTKMLEDWSSYTEVVDTTVSGCGVSDYALFVADATEAGASLAVSEVEGALGFIDGSNPSDTIKSASGAELQGIQVITGEGGGIPAGSLGDILNEWLGFYGLKQLDPADFADFVAPLAAELNLVWPQPGRGGAGSCELRYKTNLPTIETLGLRSHGIDLYKPTESAFYNSYTAYTYGGQHINTPKDSGTLMIPFNLYPGSYQPSGHINISRAREFYISYTSNSVGTTIGTADMECIAVAINFLLISDGSAVLRYST